MKITKRQLTRLIREAMTENDAKSLVGQGGTPEELTDRAEAQAQQLLKTFNQLLGAMDPENEKDKSVIGQAEDLHDAMRDIHRTLEELQLHFMRDGGGSRGAPKK